MKKGDLLWHTFKILGIMLSLLTLTILTVNRYTSATIHDFPPGGSRSNAGEDERNKLTNFLIIYPSLTAVAFAYMMDLIGQWFNDPLGKCSSLVLSGLCFILSLVAFTVSTLATLKTHFVTLIITTVLSALLVIVTILDLILLMLK